MITRKGKPALFVSLGGAVLIGLVCLSAYRLARCADHVVLTLGEPYEHVRKQSRSTLPPVVPRVGWMGVLTRPAQLRFSDPQYGFATPAARFLSVKYDRDGMVEGVTLSPQVDALPLDDVLAIVMDLQDQLRRAHWQAFRASRWRPIENTADFRRAIRNCDDPTSYWNGGAKYQIALDIRCFRPEGRRDKERFLITLDLNRPWMGDRPDD